MIFLARVSALVVLAVSLSGAARAQTSVVESPVVLTATVMTQGAESSKAGLFGVTLTTKNIKAVPYTNREVLAEMLARSLLTGSTTVTGWSLSLLKNDAGVGGLYARKAGFSPVPVPPDLLTLPSFGPSIKGGTTVTTPFGVSANGTSEVAMATASVSGVPVSGMSTNGKHTVTLSTSKTIEVVTCAMTFAGGVEGTPSARLVKGVLAIGKAKATTVGSLP